MSKLKLLEANIRALQHQLHTLRQAKRLQEITTTTGPAERSPADLLRAVHDLQKRDQSASSAPEGYQTSKHREQFPELGPSKTALSSPTRSPNRQRSYASVLYDADSDARMGASFFQKSPVLINSGSSPRMREDNQSPTMADSCDVSAPTQKLAKVVLKVRYHTFTHSKASTDIWQKPVTSQSPRHQTSVPEKPGKPAAIPFSRLTRPQSPVFATQKRSADRHRRAEIPSAWTQSAGTIGNAKSIVTSTPSKPALSISKLKSPFKTASGRVDPKQVTAPRTGGFAAPTLSSRHRAVNVEVPTQSQHLPAPAKLLRHAKSVPDRLIDGNNDSSRNINSQVQGLQPLAEINHRDFRARQPLHYEKATDQANGKAAQNSRPNVDSPRSRADVESEASRTSHTDTIRSREDTHLVKGEPQTPKSRSGLAKGASYVPSPSIDKWATASSGLGDRSIDGAFGAIPEDWQISDDRAQDEVSENVSAMSFFTSSGLRGDAPNFIPVSNSHHVKGVKHGVTESSNAETNNASATAHDSASRSTGVDRLHANNIHAGAQMLDASWQNLSLLATDPQGNIILPKGSQKLRGPRSYRTGLGRAAFPDADELKRFGWQIGPNEPGWLYGWRGGDGIEIAFTGYGPDAERTYKSPVSLLLS